MMAYKCFLPVLLIVPYVIHCTSAAVHSHNIETAERESDGSYRARDFDHYNDAGHNLEFDHEAILGSVKEAEEYDKLSPEESKRRLGLLLPKMDLNGDQFVDRKELKKWILNSFVKLSREESEERMSEADENRDGSVSWIEYLQDTFGVDQEADVGPDDTGDTGLLLRVEKMMWSLADKNGDNVLNVEEFERDVCLWLLSDPEIQHGLLTPSQVVGNTDESMCLSPRGVLDKAAAKLFRTVEVFSNPEEHEIMQPILVNQTMHERDRNEDGVLDFSEYVGDRGYQQDKQWLISEQDKFEHELDFNQDGVLDLDEVRRWIIPDNDEIAEEEVDHLFASADDDHDDLLSFHEILTHHHVFVGSEATDYGNDLLGERFDDEL